MPPVTQVQSLNFLTTKYSTVSCQWYYGSDWEWQQLSHEVVGHIKWQRDSGCWGASIDSAELLQTSKLHMAFYINQTENNCWQRIPCMCLRTWQIKLILIPIRMYWSLPLLCCKLLNAASPLLHPCCTSCDWSCSGCQAPFPQLQLHATAWGRQKLYPVQNTVWYVRIIKAPDFTQ